ncbi:MAG: hypothetical protein NC928_04440, partial [Candidatus Omnitrophica bacterium]|nr:hypothetical protein [Candidatus Omnitrophota bacterium]
MLKEWPKTRGEKQLVVILAIITLCVFSFSWAESEFIDNELDSLQKENASLLSELIELEKNKDKIIDEFRKQLAILENESSFLRDQISTLENQRLQLTNQLQALTQAKKETEEKLHQQLASLSKEKQDT